MDKLWDILVKNCRIYLAKLSEIWVPCIFFAKTKDILGQIMGYIGQTIAGYTMGYICKIYGKYSERLWDILGKNYGIDWARL